MNPEGDVAQPVSTPIACSLSSGEVRTRLREWADVLRDVQERQAIEGGIRLVFSGAASLALIADLAIREHVCCPLLRFTVGRDDEAPVLEVRSGAEPQDLIRQVFAVGECDAVVPDA